MAAYDSDSSLDDIADVQTNVTLGYATNELTGDEISHVGGHPTWLDDKVKPSAAFAKCRVCNDYMSLLLQLQADLQQHFPEDERRLFVWCCKKKQCSKKVGSVRAFREVKKSRKSRKSGAVAAYTQNTQPQSPVDLGSQLFGGSAAVVSNSNPNPFSTNAAPSSLSSNNPFSTSSQATPQSQPLTQTFADKLKLSSPTSTPTPKHEQQDDETDPWPSESSFPEPHPHFYVDAESECLEPSPALDAGASQSNSNSHFTDPDNTYEDETNTASGSSNNRSTEKDLYESPHDKTFDHFTRILAQNPEQILRYEFNGTPLLYSSTDTIATHFVLPGHNLHQKIKTKGPVKGIPACQYCGAARVFEMQLVPYLIYEVEKDNEEAMKLDGGEGMEWGTIIVGTCGKNCGDEEDGKIVFREEWVGVQWEEGGVQLKQKK